MFAKPVNNKTKKMLTCQNEPELWGFLVLLCRKLQAHYTMTPSLWGRTGMPRQLSSKYMFRYIENAHIFSSTPDETPIFT